MGLPQAGYVITVGGMNASWVPGEALIFDDSLEHEVFSPPEAGVPSMRVVLIVDVRPSRRLQALPCLPAGPPSQSDTGCRDQRRLDGSAGTSP